MFKVKSKLLVFLFVMPLLVNCTRKDDGKSSTVRFDTSQFAIKGQSKTFHSVGAQSVSSPQDKMINGEKKYIIGSAVAGTTVVP